MKIKHTPGPWSIDPYQDEDWRVNISSNGWNVASAYHMTDDPVNVDDECMANARLIAAAPELLDVLKAWTEYAINKDVPFELISQTRAAIATAEGRDA
jgi:hypothetical protein